MCAISRKSDYNATFPPLSLAYKTGTGHAATLVRLRREREEKEKETEQRGI